jgi:lipid-binding SYLF domain-containing protein
VAVPPQPDGRSRRDGQLVAPEEVTMNRLRRAVALVLVALALTGSRASQAQAASAAEIDREVSKALSTLYAHNSTAKVLSKKAKAILVFPKIWKAGFMIGGQGGEGALRENGRTVGYYNTFAASYGFQAGIQSFGYALFFMTDSALAYLKKSEGWEIGSGPSVVIVDKGMAKSLTTTTLKDDVYAVIFDQKGLMAGIGIQGSKITKIHPS